MIPAICVNITITLYDDHHIIIKIHFQKAGESRIPSMISGIPPQLCHTMIIIKFTKRKYNKERIDYF